MKKYVLTIITCAATLPLFAFNFNMDNIEIDANIKAEISTAVKENINYQSKMKEQNPDDEIIAAIRDEINTTFKQIKRNCKYRSNIFTHDFVKDQKVQKQKYEDMIKNLNVHAQIFTYMAGNFDLGKVKDIKVNCIHHDETIIEVHFTYCGKDIVVYYDYNYKDKPGQISPLNHKTN